MVLTNQSTLNNKTKRKEEPMKTNYKAIAVGLTVCLVIAGCCGSVVRTPRLRPVEWAQLMIDSDIGNFYKVSDDLYRSTKPCGIGMKELEKIGIKSIINLEEYHSDDAAAKGTSLKLYTYKMEAGDIKANKIEGDMRNVLNLIRKAEKPVLVHCYHGSDRTGAVVAMYQMVILKKPQHDVIDEFLNGGYGYHEFWYPEILYFLKSVKI